MERSVNITIPVGKLIQLPSSVGKEKQNKAKNTVRVAAVQVKSIGKG